jgi:UDP-N-acetylmuramoyl-L-alanyl-D-glutamate--2,6-diaminopimelate ligase
MGAAAAAGADLVIVTSDNPRHEDPLAIINAAAAGATSAATMITEVDRRSAIEIAIRQARAGDVVVIAGKGHETTQTIGQIARPFDDRQVARELLSAMEGMS